MDRLSTQQRSELMSRVKQRGTGIELRVRSLLHRMGWRFRLRKPSLPGKPDIIFPRQRKAIFVHGCFWHGHDCRRGALPTSNAEFWSAKIARNKQRDEDVVSQLKGLEWSVLVVWECELRNEDRLAKKLAKFLSRDNHLAR